MTILDIRAAILKDAPGDPRIVGVVDYGSGCEGRADEWSDLDLALFVRDDDYEQMTRSWPQWAARFAPILLTYVGGGNKRVIYDARQMPLRMDLGLFRQSEIPKMADWGMSPLSAGHLVLYDGSDGQISRIAAGLVGQSQALADPAVAFQHACGDLWYYLLRFVARAKRKQWWSARFEYNWIIVHSLCALMRLEAGATQRWKVSHPPLEIEQAISPERLAQLDGCVPAAGEQGMLTALRRAADLAAELCEALAERYNWPWPNELAARVIQVLRDF